jgi:hypothetical protein
MLQGNMSLQVQVPPAGRRETMKNWRTTVFGASIIVYAIAGVAKALLDGDPSTNPDFNAVLVEVLSGIGFLFAKDAKVTGGSVAATDEAVKRVG